MIDLFGTRSPDTKETKTKIKDFTRQAFGLNDDVTVMVSELRCHEEGCPPLEAVITVMHESGEKQMYKLHKAVAEISETDIFDLANKKNEHH